MRVGDTAPDFQLPDQTGAIHSLSEHLASGPVVLFFYPAAMTPGCTKESCHFRDLGAEFAAVGATRIGISADPVEKQRRFAEKYDFDYPLLSDEERQVAEAFGVKRNWGPLPNRRATFVIDTERVVLEVISSELRMDVHADRALAVLAARAETAS
jgi:thioredoxin-dependent peroxiredoxin